MKFTIFFEQCNVYVCTLLCVPYSNRQSRCTSECGRSWRRPNQKSSFRRMTTASSASDKANTLSSSSRPRTTTPTSGSLVTRWKSAAISTPRATGSLRPEAQISGWSAGGRKWGGRGVKFTCFTVLTLFGDGAREAQQVLWFCSKFDRTYGQR